MDDGEYAREPRIDVRHDEGHMAGGSAVLHREDVEGLKVLQPNGIVAIVHAQGESEHLFQVQLQFSVHRIIWIRWNSAIVLEDVGKRAHAIDTIEVSTLMNEWNARLNQFSRPL